MLLRKSQSINCAVVRIAPSQTFLRVDLENNTEARLAAHHSVIGGLGFLERENLVHRGDAVALTEQKRVFRVDRGARKSAANRSPVLKSLLNRY